MNTDEFEKRMQSINNLAEMEINRVVAEVKKLTVFRDRVLLAFHEMPQNKRSLTYLLNELGYLNHFPEGLGLYELKPAWLMAALQYTDEEE
ncbi:hypothetical protein OAA43_00100 [bacterium]|nr:hypothetical protein [bacterium]